MATEADLVPRVAVDQRPFGGTDYPFAVVSEASGIVLDLYLGYDLGPGDTEPEYPLRVHWLYGFGNVVATPDPETPTPTHDREVLIVDNSGEVVFDSTQAETYEESAWGDDRIVCEWRAARSLVRLVASTSLADDTPDNFYPEAAELDGETIEQSPGKVWSLRVGLNRFTENVALQNGYNCALTVAIPASRSLRRDTRITVDLGAGLGLGRYPGCTGEGSHSGPSLRRINGQGPAPGGNFVIDAEESYRVSSPLLITDHGHPRKADYGWPGLTDAEAASGLILFNDAKPGCTDIDYVRTYKGVSRRWFEWQDLATELQRVRDVHRQNICRWEDARECRVNAPMRLFVDAETGCMTAITVTFCNTTNCCLKVSIIYLITIYEDEDEYLLELGVPFGRTADGGWETRLRPSGMILTGSLGGITSDVVAPGGMLIHQWRLCSGECIEGDSVRIRAAVVIDPPVEGAGTCGLQDYVLDEEWLEAWADNGYTPPPGATIAAFEDKTAPLDPTIPTIATCIC